MDREREIASALRQIARGFETLAEAVGGPTPSEEARELPALQAWGTRGLTRPETSALLREHGFAPQTSGGWARGGWIETRDDGRRYLTERSLRWLAEQEAAEGA